MKTELLITSTTSAVHGRISGHSSSQDFKHWVIFTIFSLFYHLRHCKSSPTTSSDDAPQVQFHNPVQTKNMIWGMVSGFTFFFLNFTIWLFWALNIIMKWFWNARCKYLIARVLQSLKKMSLRFSACLHHISLSMDLFAPKISSNSALKTKCVSWRKIIWIIVYFTLCAVHIRIKYTFP